MWGTQVCYTARLTLESAELLCFRSHSRVKSLEWLTGLLSTLIFQPLVSYVSDHGTSHWGRRGSRI